MTYIPMPTVTDGGELKVLTTDLKGNQLLSRLVVQLLIMNTHLAEMTGEKIAESDIGG